MKTRIISKNLTVAVILLFIGVGIQPAIATPHPQGLADVDGLFAQIETVVNEIFQIYGHNPMINSYCNMILNIIWFPGKIVICILLYIVTMFIAQLWIWAWQVFDLPIADDLFNLAALVFILLIAIDCIPFPYKISNPIFSLLETKDITNQLDGCPCLQE